MLLAIGLSVASMFCHEMDCDNWMLKYCVSADSTGSRIQVMITSAGAISKVSLARMICSGDIDIFGIVINCCTAEEAFLMAGT